MDKQFTLVDLNRSILGSIKPTGVHELDLERLENIEDYSSITRTLVSDMLSNVGYRGRNEASIKEMANKSIQELKEINKMIEEILEEVEE